VVARKCSTTSARTVQCKEIGAEWMVQFYGWVLCNLAHCDKAAVSRRYSIQRTLQFRTVAASTRTQIHMAA
jgi:hypothetical protein